jgi:hypothetical protein
MYRAFRQAWSKGVTPQRLVRVSGRYGQKLVKKYVWRRFPSLHEDEKRNLADYIYHVSAAKPAGEHALSLLLAPGAWAHRPLSERFDRMHRSLPLLFVYGSHDWMDVEAGRALAATNPDVFKIRVCPDSGHQLFLGTFDGVFFCFWY